jgi:PilZ domain
VAHYEGQDRRRVERTGLATSCISTFLHKNLRHSAIMLDVSEHGAKFAIEKPSDHVELEMGDELELEIITPYGVSTCKGVVAWSLHSEEYYTWGIEFTNLSSDSRDPLRCLMESPF